MYVTAIHRVSDPAGFTKAEDEAVVAGLPDGFSLPIHAATHDHGVGVCIWEGPSIEAVRELVACWPARFLRTPDRQSSRQSTS
jgi:hypothetical protein